MRERLSRGKRTDNDEGEFVYGIPVEGEVVDGVGNETYIITNPGLQWVDGVFMTYDECIEVDPETVGDYTGLNDRNNKMIFEGDIVRYTSDLGNTHTCTVSYHEACAMFVLNFINSKTISDFMISSACACEVIGNIYDSQELLGGGET